MLETMLQPIDLGSLTLPNRIVMTTLKLGYCTDAGEVNDRHLAFYRRRARAGVGLISSEPLYVQANGRELATQLGVDSDSLIPGLRRLTEMVHAVGGLVMAHLNHAGRAANPALVPSQSLVSASDVLCPANQVKPRSLTRSEVTEVIGAFASAGRRIREAGFDAVEIPFSHGYLIHQFLSPLTNHRRDEYGGTAENRMRFGREVIAAVRDEVGPDFPIMVRLNAVDHVKGGLGLQDAVAIACHAADVTADAVSVTSGTMCESVPFCLYPSGTPKAHLLPMAAAIREAVDVPVVVAGRIRTPSVARKALSDGQADLIGLGRPLLADPDWVRKAEAGDEEAILPCAACHQGCLAQLRKGEGTGCVFNPLTGREALGPITPAKRPRHVVVAGGGPAGLQAAITAARRGHRVTLCEKNDHLGGQFRLAAMAPHKEGFLDVVRHHELMARRAGVEIRLNTEVTPTMLDAMEPDVVIAATGGIPMTIPFPGLTECRWMQATDLLGGERSVETPTAFVIGGGLVGLESADYLAARGARVTLVEMLDTVGSDMDPLARIVLTERLKRGGVNIETGTEIVRLTKSTAIAAKRGQQVIFPIETVVLAVGVRANRELPDALAGSDLECHVVGDAVEPRRALEAIREGFEVGCGI